MWVLIGYWDEELVLVVPILWLEWLWEKRRKWGGGRGEGGERVLDNYTNMNNWIYMYKYSASILQLHVYIYTYVNVHMHVNVYLHDVIGDVERKKERKKERHLRQWKNENESCLYMCMN